MIGCIIIIITFTYIIIHCLLSLLNPCWHGLPLVKPEVEFAACVIEPVLGKQMLIGSVYRPEKGKEHTLRKICDTFDNITKMNCIIAGDINFPLISWVEMSSTDRLSNVFLNTLNENMLQNVCLSPSRGNNILNLIDKYVPRKVIKVGQRFKAPWMKDSQAKRSKKKKRKLCLNTILRG